MSGVYIMLLFYGGQKEGIVAHTYGRRSMRGRNPVRENYLLLLLPISQTDDAFSQVSVGVHTFTTRDAPRSLRNPDEQTAAKENRRQPQKSSVCCVVVVAHDQVKSVFRILLISAKQERPRA